jgi:hypothetical protein
LYTHLGWRKHEDDWVYLQADGAIATKTQALKELATIQSFQQVSDPALLFLRLLRAALLGGQAHVVERRGGVPEFPERWGWRQKSDQAWVPQGTRIGWLSGDDVYLEPAIGRQVACEMAGAEQLSITVHTLSRRLHQQGLLASVDVGRGMLLVRESLGCHPRKVWHLKARDLQGFRAESARNGS